MCTALWVPGFWEMGRSEEIGWSNKFSNFGKNVYLNFFFVVREFTGFAYNLCYFYFRTCGPACYQTKNWIWENLFTRNEIWAVVLEACRIFKKLVFQNFKLFMSLRMQMTLKNTIGCLCHCVRKWLQKNTHESQTLYRVCAHTFCLINGFIERVYSVLMNIMYLNTSGTLLWHPTITNSGIFENQVNFHWIFGFNRNFCHQCSHFLFFLSTRVRQIVLLSKISTYSDFNIPKRKNRICTHQAHSRLY